jgi:hypothetical protein
VVSTQSTTRYEWHIFFFFFFFVQKSFKKHSLSAAPPLYVALS